MAIVTHKKSEICDHCGNVLEQDDIKCRLKIRFGTVKFENVLCEHCNKRFYEHYHEFMESGMIAFKTKLFNMERMIKQGKEKGGKDERI